MPNYQLNDYVIFTWQASFDLFTKLLDVDVVLQQDGLRPGLNVTVLAKIVDQITCELNVFKCFYFPLPTIIVFQILFKCAQIFRA